MEWLERYKFISPVGVCGLAMYFAVEDRESGALAVAKTYQTHLELSPEAVSGMYEDEVRLYGALRDRGVVPFFEHFVTHDGKRFLVLDPKSARELMCGHLAVRVPGTNMIL